MNSIAMNQTTAFVKENVPVKQAKILTIGEGCEDVVQKLNADGFLTTAISSQAVLDFTPTETFDAVLFYYSLHRLPEMDKTLAKVKSFLNATGKLIVEDFAKEQMDQKTASWFYPINDLIHTLTGVATSADGAKESETELERWMREHECGFPVHSGKEMLKAIEKNFGSSGVSSIPYLSHYALKGAAPSPQISQAVQKFYDWETKLIEQGQITALGLRITAKQYFSYLR